ncbi:MAG: hypothetical protein ACFFAY_06550, partial [Promethearchaeota archaeon]
MSGREVASLVWTAISGSIKLLTRSFAAILNGKGKVKNAKRRFRKELKRQGIPDEMAKDLANTYAMAGEQMLSFRYMFGL